MTMLDSEAKSWWAYNAVATEEHVTDLGHNCGHSRDFHDENGRCTIGVARIQGGGYEGNLKDGTEVWIPSNEEYIRHECTCQGEEIWHICTTPPGFNWDSTRGADKLGYEPENARYTKYGKYVWWIPDGFFKNK